MRHSLHSAAALVLGVVLALAQPLLHSGAQEATPATDSVSPTGAGAGVEVLASGLTNPRGFSWGPDAGGAVG